LARGASRRDLRHLSALLGALLSVTCLSACGSSGASTLNTAKIGRAIAESILRQHGIHAMVACPSKIARRAGELFTCTARLDVGSYPVAVTEIGNNGHVRYGNTSPLTILNIAKVEHAIEASVRDERRLRAAVSCPAEVLQQKGLVFRCSAVIRGGTRRYLFVVREIDEAGHVRYLSA
jgi:hypothetical protein